MHTKTVSEYCDHLDSYLTSILKQIQNYEKIANKPEYTQEQKDKQRTKIQGIAKDLIYNKKAAIS